MVDRGVTGHVDVKKLAGYHDPGAGDWEVVPRTALLDECKIDPDLLDEVDASISYPYAIVRYGKLCHEYYPATGTTTIDTVSENFSATKTLGATVVGLAATLSRDFERKGRKTGPLSDMDRVDDWLDAFTFNPDAHVAHVLAMVAQNADLSLGNKTFSYDTVGSVEINRLGDIVDAVLAQDPSHLGVSVKEFTETRLFAPLGMKSSSWEGKVFAYTWQSTLRDMARLGLLISHYGHWDGGQLVDAEWIYRMTQPSFEDSNTGYGYLTWLAAQTGFTFGVAGFDQILTTPIDDCSPPAIFPEHPHGLSDSPDCNYGDAYPCEEAHDVGVWGAVGSGGQLIVGHRALDLVLVTKDAGQAAWFNVIWAAVRKAVIAGDPTYHGDETAFCDAYARAQYVPDLP